MNEKAEKLKKKLGKYKYPFIILLFGIMLLLLPSTGDDATVSDIQSDESRLESLLKEVNGVGDVRVLISENGIVIACTGAENAEVRLKVTKAAAAFTGFSSDRIQILKLVRSGE